MTDVAPARRMQLEATVAAQSEMVPEEERLAAVHRYDVLDTPPDGAFDRVTALAVRLLDVPISIVSIVDRDRIWFKSHHGMDATETSRDPGLCASAIMQDAPWVISDAAKDPRTLANPLVAGSLGLRFYVGIPLTVQGAFNLGTLCVIDREPREISSEDLACLQDLAAIVVDELELRLAARRVVTLEAERRKRAEEETASFRRMSESLAAGFDSNREVGKAVGLLMAQHKIDDSDAFQILRRASNDMNMKLNQIAQELVEHHNHRDR